MSNDSSDRGESSFLLPVALLFTLVECAFNYAFLLSTTRGSNELLLKIFGRDDLGGGLTDLGFRKEQLHQSSQP